MRRNLLIVPLMLIAGCCNVKHSLNRPGQTGSTTGSQTLAQLDGNWMIRSVNGQDVTATKATLNFSSHDKRIYGFDGCNTFSGIVQEQDGKLKAELVQTLVGCLSTEGWKLVSDGLRVFEEGATAKTRGGAVELRAVSYKLELSRP